MTTTTPTPATTPAAVDLAVGLLAAPPWVTQSLKHRGLREIPGAPTAPVIAAWLQQLGAWWRDDETPWCGTFVAATMQACSIPRPQHWYRAKGWLGWGIKLDAPCLGAVVIFEREGGGHVGLVVGKDTQGRLQVLGGNQGNAVGIASFELGRVVGYRWPAPPVQPPQPMRLPLLAAGGAVSRNEA